MKNSRILNKFTRSISIKSFGLFLLIIFCFTSFKGQFKNDYVKYVDPFIGSDSHGHVFVGATVPLEEFRLVLQILTRDGIGHHHTITLTVLLKDFVI